MHKRCVQKGLTMMRPGEIATVLGRTTRLRGDLECDGDLQIDGDFEGSIRQNGGRVSIGPESRVRAHIIAQDVIVMGKVEGDIRATGRVELRSTAVVTGDIFAGRLSMEENAMLQGQVDPSRSEEREVPVRENLTPQLVEPATLAMPSQPEYRQPEYRLPEQRQPEHRQAAPLREDNSSTHRIQTATLPLNERPMPSALAAFAVGGSRNSTEREVRSVNTRNETLWHNGEAE